MIVAMVVLTVLRNDVQVIVKIKQIKGIVMKKQDYVNAYQDLQDIKIVIVHISHVIRVNVHVMDYVYPDNVFVNMVMKTDVVGGREAIVRSRNVQIIVVNPPYRHMDNVLMVSVSVHRSIMAIHVSIYHVHVFHFSMFLF